MYKLKVNNKEFAIEFPANEPNIAVINGQRVELDLIEEKKNSFHLIKDFHSYTVEVVKADTIEKKFEIQVNGNVYGLDLKDKHDELLLQLGLDSLKSKKINEIKAPMPGLVLEARVKVGDIVKKGDPVIVLEAMKMENILKSPSDGIVKKITAEKGTVVEKNQVLVIFE